MLQAFFVTMTMTRHILRKGHLVIYYFYPRIKTAGRNRPGPG